MKVLLLALFVAVANAVPIPDEEASGPVEVIVHGVPEGEPLEIGDIVEIKLKEHAAGEVVAATNLLHPYTAVGIAEAAAAAAAAAEDSSISDVIPEPVVLPSPAAPEVVPEPVVLPSPVAPEVVVSPYPALPAVIPEPVVLPSPAIPEVVPEPVVLPSPAAPEVIPEPVVLPSPALPEVIPEPVVLPSPAAPEVVPEPVALPEAVAPEVVYEPEIAEVLPSPAPQIPNGDVYNDGLVQVTVNGLEQPGVLSTLQGWFNMVLNYFSGGVQTSHQIV